MATRLQPGQALWSMSKDAEGYRTYTIVHKVEADTTDGPFNVSNTPGLPTAGDFWVVDNDVDLDAVCTPEAQITPYQADEDSGPHRWWTVTNTFTTRPASRCYQGYGTGTGNIADNPLLEPDRISGGFVKFVEEAAYDRFGTRLTNSAHEQLRGPQVEFDASRPTVVIEQNVADLEWAVLTSFIDQVNESTMWGYAARCIKYSNATWEKKWTGDCTVYYVRRLEFEINPNTFDRDVTDEGTKVLNGYWDVATGAWTLRNIGNPGVVPDASNPAHFIRLTDVNGNPIRGILNGRGLPAGDAVGTADDPGSIHVEKYSEADLLSQFGLPTVIE
jgi:hypothetical protein